MKLLAIFYFLLFHLSLAQEQVQFHSEFIQQLTPQTFKSTVSKGLFIVEFYSPTCRHCKKLAPLYIELARNFHQVIHFAQVNCKEYADFCDEQKVDGWPTLFVYHDGQWIEEYGESRTYEKMAEYLNAQSLKFKSHSEDVVELHSMDVIKQEGTIYFIKFFSPQCIHCQRLAPKYELVAQELRLFRQSHRFYMARVNCLIDQSICSSQDISGYPTMKLYANGKFVEEYRGNHEEKDIKEYLEKKIVEITKVPVNKQKQPQAKEQVAKKFVPKRPPMPVVVDGESQVVQLTSGNFKEKTLKGPWLIEFYAPWCQHCQRLQPIYEQLSKELLGKINVAKVDCTVEKQLQAQYKISGYPTIKFLFNQVEIGDYRGPRTLDSLKAFALGFDPVPIKPIVVGDYEKLLASTGDNQVFFVYLSPDSTDEPSAELSAVAMRNSKYAKFYQINNNNKLFQLDSNERYLVVVTEKKVAGQLKLDKGQSLQSLMQWVDQHKYPALIELNEENSHDLFTRKQWMVLGLLNPQISDFQMQLETLSQLARNTRGSVDAQTLFVWLDAVHWSDYSRDTFGVASMKQLPQIIIVHPDADEYFELNSKGNRITLDRFDVIETLHKARDGELKSLHIRGPMGGFVKSIVKFTSSIFDNILFSSIVLFSIALCLYYTIYRGQRNSSVDGFMRASSKAD